MKPLVLFALNKHWKFRVFGKNKWQASDASQQSIRDFWWVTKAVLYFPFPAQHYWVGMWQWPHYCKLAQCTFLCMAFLYWRAKASNLRLVPIAIQQPLYRKTFHPRCEMSEVWDVVLPGQPTRQGGVELGLPIFKLQLEIFHKEM